MRANRNFDIQDIVRFLDVMLGIAVLSEAHNLIAGYKAENIILDNNDNFWLLDFGLTRHLDLESITQSNEPFGLLPWDMLHQSNFET